MPQPIPRYAVFGHPVAHSLSPRLHALFAAQTGIALEYTAIDANPHELVSGIREFFAGGARGANITLPHKAAAFALADRQSAIAQRLGVANVLTRLPDGRVEADSNDGAGLIADLEDRCDVDPRDRNVLLLGAGGAARAAAFALLDAGVKTLVIANRTTGRARTLADATGETTRVRVCHWDELDGDGAFDLIVNATSAGVQHATLTLPPSLVHVRTFAYDLSYGNAASLFMRWANEAGCAAAFDGMGMLVETAAASFEDWHGVRPNTSAALRALRLPNAG
ncbi:MAG TPA: shikimate dehydrogenase [Rhodanobacteraceae bacterium]|nr:shikimate dehydrogenase [Rhodanobacteraceae bacterium]